MNIADVDWKTIREQVDLFIEDVAEAHDIPVDYVIGAMLEQAFDHYLQVRGTLATVSLMANCIQNLANQGPGKEMDLLRRMYN